MQPRRALMFVVLLAMTLFAVVPAARALEGTLYRIENGSSREEGCLPPCLCPIQLFDDYVGTFELIPASSDFCYQYFKVKRVNWVYFNGVRDVRVTGEGEYQVGGCRRPMHRLQLSLSEDGSPTRHFDSGLVSGGGMPDINIAIAVNGFYCFDTVYNISASPVPDKELVPYGLHHTEYLEGCFDPCDCVLRSWIATGGFLLVDINTSNNPARKRRAVIDFVAETFGPIDPPDRSWTGLGIYSTGQSDERLVLDLTDPTVGFHLFDSGFLPYAGPWPEINIDISTNGFFCFNYAFYLHARPL
ncbi:MAG: hypothetical protein H7210_05535 [Pyrinomonadaceae bacterium]|nr:hypothetical protein [Phycisphaerales bacterium]